MDYYMHRLRSMVRFRLSTKHIKEKMVIPTRLTEKMHIRGQVTWPWSQGPKVQMAFESIDDQLWNWASLPSLIGEQGGEWTTFSKTKENHVQCSGPALVAITQLCYYIWKTVWATWKGVNEQDCVLCQTLFLKMGLGRSTSCSSSLKDQSHSAPL